MPSLASTKESREHPEGDVDEAVPLPLPLLLPPPPPELALAAPPRRSPLSPAAFESFLPPPSAACRAFQTCETVESSASHWLANEGEPSALLIGHCVNLFPPQQISRLPYATPVNQSIIIFFVLLSTGMLLSRSASGAS